MRFTNSSNDLLLIDQCMVPHGSFEGVESTSKSVQSSDSQLLLSRPSVNGVLKKHTRKIKTTTRVSYILFPVRTSC